MSNTPEALPFVVPPSQFIRAVGNRLDPAVPRTVLDVGMGEGRHSIYLAGLGHEVMGVSNDPEEVIQATDRAMALGLTACKFIEADARQMSFAQRFDIVLANDLLQLMSKRDSGQVLTRMQGLTKQGGVNAVSGYVVKPGTANPRNTSRMLSPDELEKAYRDVGWQILDYTEEYHPNSYTKDGKEHVYSQARLIAQRPW